MLIKKKILPSIHPNKLQVFLGSLVPLLVSNTIFLHNRFETWWRGGQRKREKERWKRKGRMLGLYGLWVCMSLFVASVCVCVHGKSYSASFLTFSLVIIFLNLNPKPSRLFVSGSVVRDITFILLTNVDPWVISRCMIWDSAQPLLALAVDECMSTMRNF